MSNDQGPKTNEDVVAVAIRRVEELARLGQMEAAEAGCRELLTRAPQDSRGWASLGMVKLLGGRAAEAEGPLKQAIGLYANDARYWNMLSLALRVLSRG